MTTRTIRRDLQALEEAGFPLYDDRSHDDGRTRWKINGQAFKGLAAGLTLAELCALYFSRTLLESLAGTPFRDDVERAFEKLSAALTPHMRQFLDQLPRVIAAKADPSRRRDDPRSQQIIARALEATLHLRQASITYHSKSSERTKTYLVHPYRLAYAQGGLYLLAYVPGVQRGADVRRRAHPGDLSLLEERFTPIEELPDAAFPHSLGVHSGPPEHVEIEFQPAVADYVRARDWHPSQQVRERRGRRAGDDAGRLQRPRAPELDPELRSLRPRRVAAAAGARDRGAVRGSQGAVRVIRLLAIDIDGTLLDSRGHVPDAHRDALVDAAAAGVEVALATGRSFHFTRPIAHALPLPLTLIVNNGALVKEGDGTTRLRHLLDRDVARDVLAGTAAYEDSVALVFDRAPSDEERQILFERMDWDHPNRRGYFEKNQAFIGAASPLAGALDRGSDPGDVQRRRGADAGAGRRAARAADRRIGFPWR